MSRLVRWSLVLVGATVVGLLAVGVIGVAWSDRASDVCREQAPASASGYSVNWEWSEAAYVCTYRARNAETKRVGIIDAFHGEGRRRHRP